MLEVLAVFTRLGLTSFGGPIAHLGYFRAEFVARRRWLDEATYADLVALCQFLPGPASSQPPNPANRSKPATTPAAAAVLRERRARQQTPSIVAGTARRASH